MAAFDAAVREQKDIDRAVRKRELRGSERANLSWPLMSLLLSHILILHRTRGLTKAWRAQSQKIRLVRRVW
jgi:hypothetical protein